MTRWVVRWLLQVLVVIAVAFVVAYGGDFAVFKLRGSPQSTVTVNRFVTIPLKGNKQEFDYMGAAQVSCARALFPHAGAPACWWLRRHTTQWE